MIRMGLRRLMDLISFFQSLDISGTGSHFISFVPLEDIIALALSHSQIHLVLGTMINQLYQISLDREIRAVCVNMSQRPSLKHVSLFERKITAVEMDRMLQEDIRKVKIDPSSNVFNVIRMLRSIDINITMVQEIDRRREAEKARIRNTSRRQYDIRKQPVNEEPVDRMLGFVIGNLNSDALDENALEVAAFDNNVLGVDALDESALEVDLLAVERMYEEELRSIDNLNKQMSDIIYGLHTTIYRKAFELSCYWVGDNIIQQYPQFLRNKREYVSECVINLSDKQGLVLFETYTKLNDPTEVRNLLSQCIRNPTLFSSCANMLLEYTKRNGQLDYLIDRILSAEHGGFDDINFINKIVAESSKCDDPPVMIYVLYIKHNIKHNLPYQTHMPASLAIRAIEQISPTQMHSLLNMAIVKQAHVFIESLSGKVSIKQKTLLSALAYSNEKIISLLIKMIDEKTLDDLRQNPKVFNLLMERKSLKILKNNDILAFFKDILRDFSYENLYDNRVRMIQNHGQNQDLLDHNSRNIDPFLLNIEKYDREYGQRVLVNIKTDILNLLDKIEQCQESSDWTDLPQSSAIQKQIEDVLKAGALCCPKLYKRLTNAVVVLPVRFDCHRDSDSLFISLINGFKHGSPCSNSIVFLVRLTQTPKFFFFESDYGSYKICVDSAVPTLVNKIKYTYGFLLKWSTSDAELFKSCFKEEGIQSLFK